MGYTTTFTIKNDGISKIRKESDEFCEKLYEHAVSGKGGVFGHGSAVNLVRVQRAIDSIDSTIYVNVGGAVCEMNAYSKETEAFMREHPELFKRMLKLMGQHTRGLWKNLKKYQTELELEESELEPGE